MGRKKWKAYRTKLEVIDAASDGRAVAKENDRVVFIKQAVPGDLLEVELYKREKKALAGRIVQIISPSSDRIQPRCEHFGVCGGCKWQMMSYESQLRYKEKQVRDSFERIAKVEVEEFLSILPSPSPFYYRNKLEFTFGTKAWLTKEQIATDEVFDSRVLGFHAPGYYDKIIDVESCYLQNSLINAIRNSLRDFCRAKNIPFYNVHTHEGFLRNLIFRSSQDGKELMVVLVVKELDSDFIHSIFSHLTNLYPQVSSWIYIVNNKLNSSFSELPYTVWKGSETIEETLDDYRFQISPTSFFQTNPQQAQRMYSSLREWIEGLLPPGKKRFDCIYDLYTGTGSIAIFISKLAQKIVGVEYVESAVGDARKNIELNELDTEFSFYAGDMKKILSPDLIAREGKPDLVITDPPRQGMDKKVVEQLLTLASPFILYISCKPATQARDISFLDEKYQVVRIQPIDMFPQTAHVENMALLKLRP